MSRLLWLDTALILAVGSGTAFPAAQQDPARLLAAAPAQEKAQGVEVQGGKPGAKKPATPKGAVPVKAGAPVRLEAKVEVAPAVVLGGGVVRFGAQGGGDDRSENVKLNESTNLDRYLMKAQEFLAKDDYDGVRTLQAVIEGRAVDPGSEPGTEPATESVEDALDSADLAVFGRDQRLYVPVTSYCHQLLAALPEEALEAYRSEHDAEAGRMLQKAMAGRDLDGVNEVIRRYFVSRSGDDALDYAGDLLMDRGRYRRAIQMWETIVDLYPRDADVSLKDVLAKTAFAYARLGERRKVTETLDRLKERSPDASVRIAGELTGIEQLRTHPQFLAAADPHEHDVAAEPPPLPALAFHWLHRFDARDPFAEEKKSNTNQPMFVQGGIRSIPRPAFFPGTSVTAAGSSVFVKEHDRLLQFDLATGKLLWRGGGNPQPPKKRQGTQTPRNPLFDFAGMRVHHDGARLYVTEENLAASGNAQGLTFKNALAAYSLGSGTLEWSTEKHEGTPLKGTLFLAPPTPYEGRLYAPAVVKGWFTILCLDAQTGAELWRLPISGGGTRFVRPPASPLVIDDGAVIFLTNAGTVAAADTADGRLRWIRKYELEDPRDAGRRRPRPRQPNMGFVQSQVTMEKITGFAPTAPIAVDGKVIIAPSDASVLLCLDAATGELLWLLPKESEGKFDYVVGHDGEHLFLAGSYVQSIHLRTGKRIWERPVMDKFAGRGFVTRDHVYLPSPDGLAEGLVRLRNDGTGEIERAPITIPALDPPLQGPYDMALEGDHLILSAAGWVGVWSDFASWAEKAARGPLEEAASVLALAGRSGDALAKYLELARSATDPAQRATRLHRAVVLAGEHALSLAKRGDARAADEVLDRVLAEVTDRDDRLRLMLDRVETRKASGDAAGANAARDALREFLDRG